VVPSQLVPSQRPALPRTYPRLAAGTAVALVTLVLALSGCSSSSNAPAPTTSPAAGATKHPRVAGPITAENGSTWTVLTTTGQTYTVIITNATAFGTKTDPATKDQFRVGDIVHVTGTMSGTAITASRVTSASNPLG
jgi:hypothetical protein